MSLAYFPMYPTDFEADTSHLTLEEDGAYNRLLRLMWMTPGCSLPADDTWIMRRMRVDSETFFRVVKPLLNEFFKVEKARLFSPRLTREYEHLLTTREKRSEAGKKGGRPSIQLKNNRIDKSPDKAGYKHARGIPEPEPYKEEPDGSSNSAPAKKLASPRSELETVLDADHAQAVIDHRQRIRKPLTAHAARLLAGKFAQVASPNAAADAMIANGWQGFEPEWLEGRLGRQPRSPPDNPMLAALTAGASRGIFDAPQRDRQNEPDNGASSPVVRLQASRP